MPSKLSQELTPGNLIAPDSENHDVVIAVPVAGCNAEVQLAPGGVDSETKTPIGAEAPRVVIRDESSEKFPSTKKSNMKLLNNPSQTPSFVGSGAPPSNTAPANCIDDNNEPIKVLRSGIDSLYLSYPGSLSFSKYLELDILKQQARSEIELDQAEAVYELPGHYFQLHGKGAGLYSYVLSDNAYRINLSGFGAKQLPLAYVQIKSDWLVLRGVRGACAELDVIVEHFSMTDERVEANISRADLFVDFTSTYSFAELSIASWISRAKRISTHTIGRAFTGYSIGLGGDLSARLYDKTLEIEESKKDYLKQLWSEKGWDGRSTVWRLEFQYKRRILVEHDARTIDGLLLRLGSLWLYSTTSWLKLTIPNSSDSTQSRWPLHPVWEALSMIDWGLPNPPISIPVRASNPPSDHFLFINGLSGITSYMAREGIADPDIAFERFKEAAWKHHDLYTDYNGKSFKGYLLEKAAAKARQYNLPFPGIGETAKALVTQAKAKAYKKARDDE
jgi:hypothetical protein